MGVFDLFGKKNNKSDQANYRFIYNPQQDAQLEQFIEENFGPIDTRIHDICGTDIKVDLCFISPNERNPSYLLVTKGLGAYLMAVSDINDPNANVPRLELVLDSGEPWEIGFGENRDYWAQQLCSAIGQHMVNQGLTLPMGNMSLADLGINIEDAPESFLVCPVNAFDAYENFAPSVALGSYESVSFILLADPQEDDAQDESDADPFAHTPSAGYTGTASTADGAVSAVAGAATGAGAHSHADDALFTMEKEQAEAYNEYLDEVDELFAIAPELGIDPINAYNRAAHFVRWALLRDYIQASYVPQLQGDIRAFLQENLKSVHVEDLFTAEGASFVNDYYSAPSGESANYIEDLHLMMLQDADRLFPEIDGIYSASLYLPYNDDTFNQIVEMLDETVEISSHYMEYDEPEDSELFDAVAQILPNDNLYFAATNDDYQVTSVFSYSHEYYRYEKDDNEECALIIELNYNYVKGLINYQCPNSAQADSFACDPSEAAASAEQALQEVEQYLGTAPEILARLMENNLEDLEQEGISLEELRGDLDAVLAQVEAADEEQTAFGPYDFDSYWRGREAINPETNEREEITSPVMLTYLPVSAPYQTLAYVPFVPTGIGMSLAELMSVAAYFEERYEAYVAVVSVDTIEFTVDAELTREQAEQAAQDLYAFCPLILDQCGVDNPTLADLAAFIMRNPIWTCSFDYEGENNQSEDPEQHADDDSLVF